MTYLWGQVGQFEKLSQGSEIWHEALSNNPIKEKIWEPNYLPHYDIFGRKVLLLLKGCPSVPKLQRRLLRGWGRCLKVTLQIRKLMFIGIPVKRVQTGRARTPIGASDFFLTFAPTQTILI